MKKIAIAVAIMMLFAGPAWCLNATVDHTIGETMKSDIRPIEDTGKVLDMTNKGLDKGYHMVTDPMAPVLDPVRKVRDESVKGTKTVLNVIYDALTLKHFREKK